MFCFESGAELKKVDDDSVYVAYIENGVYIKIRGGDYIKIRGADYKDCTKKLIVSVASDGDRGKIEIKLD